MKKSMLILIILALASLTLVAGCNKGQEASDSGTIEDDHPHEVGVPDDHHDEDEMGSMMEDMMEKSQNVVEINMIAKQWEFNPSTITVNKGDTVKLHIKSIDVTHGFGLPTFNINERLNPGKTVDIEFVADKTGTFSFFCTVQCGRGHGGMRGTLIVS